MEEILKLEFLTDVNYLRVCIGVIIIYLCSKLIEHTYKKYVISNDNKMLFTKHMFNFLIAIFLIVTVIKSSIALSLGLVGALSIIRFRTAIKEPGQLINLLVLTSIAISVAAEKEVLGIMITIIYYLNSLTTYEKKADKLEDDLVSSKLLRISIANNDVPISKYLKIKNSERIYKDVNNIIHLEFLVTSKKEELNLILEEVKSFSEILTYEVI